jgi:hypothetical protein
VVPITTGVSSRKAVMLQRSIVLAAMLTSLASSAFAQEAAKPQAEHKIVKRPTIVIYPILAWAPIFGASAILPRVPDLPGLPGSGPGSGSGESGSASGSLNAAAALGVGIEKDKWLFTAQVLWAGLSGTAERPNVKITSDVVFSDMIGGRQIYKGLAVVGGVRRIAFDVGVQLGDLPEFSRKPGVWDPLVGIDWRQDLGRKWTTRLEVVGGGFGVGSDVDTSAKIRFEWRFASHVQLSLGYGVLYLKESIGVGDRTFKFTETLNGPEIGIGIGF